jgi:predicted protein tyrosine phosphatase
VAAATVIGIATHLAATVNDGVGEMDGVREAANEQCILQHAQAVVKKLLFRLCLVAISRSTAMIASANADQPAGKAT